MSGQGVPWGAGIAMSKAEQLAKKLAEFQKLAQQGKAAQAWKVRSQYFQLKLVVAA